MGATALCPRHTVVKGTQVPALKEFIFYWSETHGIDPLPTLLSTTQHPPEASGLRAVPTDPP